MADTRPKNKGWAVASPLLSPRDCPSDVAAGTNRSGAERSKARCSGIHQRVARRTRPPPFECRLRFSRRRQEPRYAGIGPTDRSVRCEKPGGILRSTAQPDFEVQVRSRRTSGRPHAGDALAAHHEIALRCRELRHVGITRDETATVIDLE